MAKSSGGDRKTVADRRDFLKFAGLGAVAGSATIVAGTATAGEVATDPNGAGYQETAHVRTYYELTRF